MSPGTIVVCGKSLLIYAGGMGIISHCPMFPFFSTGIEAEVLAGRQGKVSFPSVRS